MFIVVSFLLDSSGAGAAERARHPDVKEEV
jgi:hypothetical protein